MAAPRKSPAPDSSLPAPMEIVRCYVRVSDVGGRDTQTEANPRREFLSPDIQLASGAAWATMHGHTFDLDNSTKHADIGQSGFSKSWRKRPGIVAHLEAARRGEFQHLTIYTLSRLARNVMEGLELIREFQAAGIAIHLIREGIDTDTATGRLLLAILLAVAEMEAEGVREWARAAVSRRAQDGKMQGRPPFWICRNPDTDEYELDPIGSGLMLRLVELREEPMGYARVAQRLNAEGYRTEDNTPWSLGLVQHYLQPNFIDRLAGKQVIRMAEGTVHILEDAYPALLDADRVAGLKRISKTLMSPNAGGPGGSASQKKRGASATTSYLLSSRVSCARCGSALYSSSYVSSGRSYRCPNAQSNKAAHTDSERQTGGVFIDAESAEDAVLRVLRYVMSITSPPKLDGKPAKPRRSPPPKPAGETVESIRAAMSELVSMRLAKRIQPEDYDKHYTDYLERLEALEKAESTEDEPSLLSAAIAAHDEGNDRGVVLSLAKSIVMPVDAPEQESVTARRKIARRSALVTLRIPTPLGRVFLAPLYRKTHKGMQTIYVRQEDGSFLLVPLPTPPISPSA